MSTNDHADGDKVSETGPPVSVLGGLFRRVRPNGLDATAKLVPHGRSCLIQDQPSDPQAAILAELEH